MIRLYYLTSVLAVRLVNLYGAQSCRCGFAQRSDSIKNFDGPPRKWKRISCFVTHKWYSTVRHLKVDGISVGSSLCGDTPLKGMSVCGPSFRPQGQLKNVSYVETTTIWRRSSMLHTAIQTAFRHQRLHVAWHSKKGHLSKLLT